MMIKFFFKINFVSNLIGFDAQKFVHFFMGIFSFYPRDFFMIKKQMKKSKNFPFGKFFPILNERSIESGTSSGHYFHQDLLIAQKVFVKNPIRHIDIGSRIDGFVAHVAVFREIEIFDIRKTLSNSKNITYTQADLMQLPSTMIECCDSISSLHAIEHFGLGRYGDPIDIDGHLKAVNNIFKMLKNDGKFYFSVPIGPNRIEFNAHRVFSLRYLIDMFQGKFKIDNFNYVDDNGFLHCDVNLTNGSIDDNYNCFYGCGIFELTKI